MDSSSLVATSAYFAAACIPAAFALSALTTGRVDPLRRTAWAAGLAGVLAPVAVLGALLARGASGGDASATAGDLLPLAMRLDVVSGVMLVLVCTIAVVIARYSRTYLAGEPGLQRYGRALASALACVTLLVISDHLLVIALSWIGTGISLHPLLTFYRERPQAQVAAHKKFILSRSADVCLLAAVFVLWHAAGDLHLGALAVWAETHGAGSTALRAGTLLLACGVLLKSAQLPFHGWLIQVMEAPTPVSALLHAGVVNIGGFVLIRLASLMAHAPAAQTVLVVVGTITAATAALVMTTRISIKVSLAWSTCAQMGFMLVECGLGAWHLALLHLVAHSLYKAHAFLRAGSVVEDWRVKAIAPASAPASAAGIVAAAAPAFATIWAGYGLARHFGGPTADPMLSPLATLLSLAAASFAASGGAGGRRQGLGAGLRIVGVVIFSFGWHAIFSRIGFPKTEPAAAAWVVAAAGFGLLFLLQAVMSLRPDGRTARSVRPILFAGLYLDELFTRMTFRLWPPRTTVRPGRALATTDLFS